uniref:Double-stranded ribonuclease 1 n=1 Tax=Diabrotica virgifera virgifera TaxID=50390 RepID=A0A7G7Y240_DIAVI|nr:double-stranded ribonuclease 1 [Diabrotica virgifera virgifera]
MVRYRCVFSWLILGACSQFGYSASRAGCTFNVYNNANEKYMPVMLTNHSSKYELIVPEQGQIHLRSGEGITFVCPEKNYLVLTNSNFTYATCIQGTNLKLFRNTYNFDSFLCSKSIRGQVQKTKEKCGNRNGEIINIGYKVTKRYFKPLISVCYDEKNGKALYSQHVIHGEEVAYTSRFKERPNFSTDGLAKDVSANLAYKRAYQKSTFSSLLGSSREAEQYINTKSYLSRGHLSPDADFLFASSQLTSYFYINTCPQWQSINGGNWVRVESAVRRVADKYHTTFLIITGTHDVLDLPDVHDNPIEMYLVSKRKLPVPKFVWKIMLDENSGKAIAFVSLNNPFVQEITEDEQLCSDICEQYGWGSKYYSDFCKGYIYCCDVNELRETVDTIPVLNVNGILQA